MVQQQCEVHTDVRATNDALDYDYKHDAPQEEQRTQRASLVATYLRDTHSSISSTSM